MRIFFQLNRAPLPPCFSRIALPPPPAAGAAALALLRGGAGPAAERRPLVLGAAVAQRQAEPGQHEEEGHVHLQIISFFDLNLETLIN